MGLFGGRIVGWEEIGFEASTFKIYRNPLINWTWVGGFILILGTIVAAWVPSNRQADTYSLKQPRPEVGYATGD